MTLMPPVPPAHPALLLSPLPVPAPCPCLCDLPVSQLGDKADLVKKGTAPHEATTKLAAATQQLSNDTLAWVDGGIKLADS